MAAIAREKQSEKSMDLAKRFIVEELGFVASSYEAEQICQSLKDQRLELGRKKTNLLKRRELFVSFEEPSRKRRSTEDGAALSIEDDGQLARIDEDLRNIDHQQMLCSDELNKLQRECGSIDFDSRAESRWNDIGTIASARVFLKALFEQATNARKSIVDQDLELRRLRDELKNAKASIDLEKKNHDEKLRALHESNRKLLLGVQKQISQIETKYFNFLATVSTMKTIDSGTAEEMKVLHDNVQRLSQTGKQLESKLKPSASRGLTRSRSSSCLGATSGVLTTEEERRSRASRARIQRYGNVVNPIVEVPTEDSDEGESFMDVTYNPEQKKSKPKPKIVTDLSPILDLTKIVSSSNGGYVSPRSRRLSMKLEEPPTTNAEVPEKENTVWNETFVISGDSATPKESDANAKAPDVKNPTKNATLTSGLEPHLDPTLGPI
ncbi:hypothetical protein KIN20_012143 [Parelaphostrongylus tenuis]|uniref:Uncharacterized protein n=1 Tax=Parelaphostrongylus tenuis TaxID=148309 RepID=A0AAD5MUI8_PARTN|nr:hypothetical protein KIN20_012143 [Parelaphostrongylus tenuis]